MTVGMTAAMTGAMTGATIVLIVEMFAIFIMTAFKAQLKIRHIKILFYLLMLNLDQISHLLLLLFLRSLAFQTLAIYECSTETFAINGTNANENKEISEKENSVTFETNSNIQEISAISVINEISATSVINANENKEISEKENSESVTLALSSPRPLSLMFLRPSHVIFAMVINEDVRAPLVDILRELNATTATTATMATIQTTAASTITSNTRTNGTATRETPIKFV
jgi:hypothetical protein